MPRDTKLIGERTEVAVLAALVKGGRTVLLPFGERLRYDLLIDDGGHFHRVQCKTGRLRNGVVLFMASSVHWHRGGKRRGYKGECEFFGVYCRERDEVYLLPVDLVCGMEGSLR